MHWKAELFGNYSLNTIQARSYVTLDEKKRFTPTGLGSAVTEMFVENLPDIMDFKFTADMVFSLAKIARGALKRYTFLTRFYMVPFAKL